MKDGKQYDQEASAWHKRLAVVSHPICFFPSMQCRVIRTVCLVLQAERRPEEFGLPEMVQHYHSLFPLEDLQAAAEQPSGAFGVCTALVRAASPQLQGQAVTLRRLDPRQVSYNISIF